MMHNSFGFSYIGLIWLLMLTIPNILWTKNIPEGYSSKEENKILIVFEKLGETLVTVVALIFNDFNLNSKGLWTIFLALSFILMLLYEYWWLRYFTSKKTLKDFYSSLLGIPLAGATLPVLAFLFLGIYGKNIFMLISVIILGIGHIGIHLQHLKKLKIFK